MVELRHERGESTGDAVNRLHRKPHTLQAETRRKAAIPSPRTNIEKKRNKNDFFFPPQKFREARKIGWVGLPLASPDMLYKERTPKTNLRGSQSGGYLLSHNIPQCSTIGDAVSLPCALSAARSLPRPRAAGAHSPHPTPSATADTAHASEAGLAMSNGD